MRPMWIAAAVFCASLGGTALAVEPTLVRVIVTDGGGERSFTGVVAGDGAVMTSSAALGSGTSADRVQVEPPSGGDKRVATSIARTGNVAVIKVEDVRGPTPVFALEDPSRAGTWIVKWLSKTRPNSNIGVFQREPSNGIGRMEAQVQGQAFGAPLLNECNQIVGLVIPFGNKMERIETQTRSEVLEPVVQVALASSVKAALTRNNAIVNTSAAACNGPPVAGDSATGAAGASAGAEADRPPSAEAALQKEEAENATVLDRLQDEIDELEARNQTDSQAYKNAQRRLRDGEREKQRIADELKRAREEGDAYKSFGEEQREKSEKRQKWIVYGSIGAAVLLILVGLVGWYLVSGERKRRLSASGERDSLAEKARRASSARDYTLVGSHRKIKLPGVKLVDESRGVVVGRSTNDADVLLESERVSRRHAKFYLRGDALYIEDLGSTNGSSVNSRKLAGNTPTELRVGDTVELGDERFTVRAAS